MTDKTPEALEAADWLETSTMREDRAAAALLRRQHQRIEALEWSLRGAANYIDKLGGVSNSYRALLSTTQQEGSQA